MAEAEPVPDAANETVCLFCRKPYYLVESKNGECDGTRNDESHGRLFHKFVHGSVVDSARFVCVEVCVQCHQLRTKKVEGARCPATRTEGGAHGFANLERRLSLNSVRRVPNEWQEPMDPFSEAEEVEEIDVEMADEVGTDEDEGEEDSESVEGEGEELGVDEDGDDEESDEGTSVDE